MNTTTQLTKDVILFQENIEKIIKLFILTGHPLVRIYSDLDLDNHLLRLSMVDILVTGYYLDKIPSSYIQNKHLDENEYKLIELTFLHTFLQHRHNSSFSQSITLGYLILPQLDNFFLSRTSECNYIFYNTRRNRFFLKYLFLNLQKTFQIDILNFLDDFIWQLI